MKPEPSLQVTAFSGTRLLARGPLPDVAVAARRLLDTEPYAAVLIFDDTTAHTVEVDLRGTEADVAQRLGPTEVLTAAPDGPAESPAEASPRGPGRPKLGVVPREVTLLPRHWAWLNAQPGGASVALRRLVEVASRDPEVKLRDRVRERQTVAYRFLSTLAGDLPGFEAASRALFAGARPPFVDATAAWPAEVREYALGLAGEALG